MGLSAATQVLELKMNCALSAPVMATMGTVEGTPPVFVTVKVCGAATLPTTTLLKSFVIGEIESAAEASPVPVSAKLNMPPGMPLTSSDAVNMPTERGVKVMLMLQLPPGPMVPLQVLLLMANDDASVPLSDAMMVPVAAAPSLVMVKESGLLV
jgi:hypothetical protein